LKRAQLVFYNAVLRRCPSLRKRSLRVARGKASVLPERKKKEKKKKGKGKRAVRNSFRSLPMVTSRKKLRLFAGESANLISVCLPSTYSIRGRRGGKKTGSLRASNGEVSCFTTGRGKKPGGTGRGNDTTLFFDELRAHPGFNWLHSSDQQ